MPETWFISDTHFSHTNILQYEKEARPFTTVEEMNESIIDRWNSVVKPMDTIYHLGDFAFGRENISIAGRLRGKKRLIMGNHDAYSAHDYLKYFDRVYGVNFWEQCILSHVPVHRSHFGMRNYVNVHGHLHSKYVVVSEKGLNAEQVLQNYPDPNYFNVSCEQNNLTPIHADVIRQRVKELKE